VSSRLGRLALETSLYGAEAADCEYAAESSARPPRTGTSFLGQLKLRFRSDENLMEDLQAGEADALTVLFHRHSPLVFGVAYRVLHDSGEAEEAVQQVFLDLFRSRQNFDPNKGTFKTWLLMFAYHRTFNRRRHLCAARFYDSHEIEAGIPESLEAGRRAFPFSAPETAVLVQEGLALLQPRQRRTIELVYLEGLTAEEISLRTGESVRVVRHNLYRGLEKLRMLLCGQSTPRSLQPQERGGRGSI
jgi:RNA polymerase sigma-70 factor, ECF subfamily